MSGPYRTQVVRDLAWLIESPPLLRDGIEGLPLPPQARLAEMAAASVNWLQSLDENAEAASQVLADALESPGKSLRLGHYSEGLLEAWLSHLDGITMHGSRIDVAENGRTLGELDVVFSDKIRDHIVHWEMAVKFYLRSDRAEADWIGLDGEERLNEKIRRLIDHQLPLGAEARRRGLIPGSGNLLSEAFVKGWVFDPAEGVSRTSGSFISAKAARGWWIRHGETPIPTEGRASRFAVMHRNDWLSPVHRPDDGIFVPRTLAEVERHLQGYFTRLAKPALVAELRRDQNGWWKEIARGMVVAADWYAADQLRRSDES